MSNIKFTKKMSGRTVCNDRPVVKLGRATMLLGSKIQHGIYDGVDAGTVNLLHGVYDSDDATSVDPGMSYSPRVSPTGKIVFDRFDRAQMRNDGRLAMSKPGVPSEPAAPAEPAAPSEPAAPAAE